MTNKNNDSILEGLVPCNGHVLVLGGDDSYQSPNGVVSTLKKGGSAVNGTVIRLGANVPEELLGSECLILKYECQEIMDKVFLVDYKTDKLRMFKKLNNAK